MQARFATAMHSIIAAAKTNNTSNSTAPLRIAVAYSGGLDSSVLLQLCALYAQQNQISLMAFHVHHGLSPNADDWALHCQQQCSQLGIPFEVAHVQLGSTQGDGLEAAARKKRYAALGQLCVAHQIDILLTAHHQDDQAETMLLQMLRGAGVAGLCGMQQSHYAAGLLGSTTLILARPLLSLARTELETCVEQHAISHIQDESNADPRYTRNALRLEIMPLLAQHFPGFQTRFARTAQHAQSALYLLEQLAEQDYQQCLTEPGSSALNVLALQLLPEERIDNVLRFWIATYDVQMPSSARLAEIRKQLLHARADAQVCVKHGPIEVHRYRSQLSIASCAQPEPEPVRFQWQGEASLAFPGFSGSLHFIDALAPGQFGIERSYLLAQQLELRPRQGGERLKLAANRPTRDMKSHYQSHAIPYWQRERLPFVFAADNTLLFASGIGINGLLQVEGSAAVGLRWQAD